MAFLGAFHGRTYGAMSPERLQADAAPGVRAAGPRDPPRPLRRPRERPRPAPDHLPARRAGGDLRRADPGRGRLHRPARRLPARPPGDLRRGTGPCSCSTRSSPGSAGPGRMFASEHWGVAGDIVCLAKGIANGLPLGAIVARADVMDWPQRQPRLDLRRQPRRLRRGPGHAPAGRAPLHGQRRAPRAISSCDGLRDLAGRHPAIKEVRGLGLMVGMEVQSDGAPDPDLRDRIIELAFRRGLLLLPCGPSTVRFCPPLCLTAPPGRDRPGDPRRRPLPAEEEPGRALRRPARRRRDSRCTVCVDVDYRGRPGRRRRRDVPRLGRRSPLLSRSWSRSTGSSPTSPATSSDASLPCLLAVLEALREPAGGDRHRRIRLARRRPGARPGRPPAPSDRGPVGRDRRSRRPGSSVPDRSRQVQVDGPRPRHQLYGSRRSAMDLSDAARASGRCTGTTSSDPTLLRRVDRLAGTLIAGPASRGSIGARRLWPLGRAVDTVVTEPLPDCRRGVALRRAYARWRSGSLGCRGALSLVADSIDSYRAS